MLNCLMLLYFAKFRHAFFALFVSRQRKIGQVSNCGLINHLSTRTKLIAIMEITKTIAGQAFAPIINC